MSPEPESLFTADLSAIRYKSIGKIRGPHQSNFMSLRQWLCLAMQRFHPSSWTVNVDFNLPRGVESQTVFDQI